jgi:excisionase family DNA binding protein
MKDDPKRTRPEPANRRPPEDLVLLKAELRRRGMSAVDIEQTLRKKRRRKSLEFDLVKSRRVMTPEKAALRLTKLAKPAKRGREVSSSKLRDICSVDVAADLLSLHPKTVLRFIRDGRLPARRIGKSYRILRADLDAFAGFPTIEKSADDAARVTSVVDLAGVGPQLAKKWATTITGVLRSRPEFHRVVSADVVYASDRSHLKIIIVGAPADTANLMRLIGVWLEQLR